MTKLPSVCLVTGGLSQHNSRLQPWRYLFEVAQQLGALGHAVSVVTDGDDVPDVAAGTIRFFTIRGVQSTIFQKNAELNDVLSRSGADVILWHVGLSSFLHQTFPANLARFNIGIFTSPIYSFADLKRVGIRKLLKNVSLSGMHLFSTLTPRWLFRARRKHLGLQNLVVQTQTLREQLQKLRLWSDPLQVIPPGVDTAWSHPDARTRMSTRSQCGYSEENRVIVYFGSPAPLRGTEVLVRAFEIARQQEAGLKLLILSRRKGGELSGETNTLNQLVQSSPARSHMRVVDGMLDQTVLMDYAVASDAVALPFELLPSDAPLSLLEVAALGLPVVTTKLACLPELARLGRHCLAEPSNPASLAGALLQAVRENHFSDRHPWTRSWHTVGCEWSEYLQRLS